MANEKHTVTIGGGSGCSSAFTLLGVLFLGSLALTRFGCKEPNLPASGRVSETTLASIGASVTSGWELTPVEVGYTNDLGFWNPEARGVWLVALLLARNVDSSKRLVPTKWTVLDADGNRYDQTPVSWKDEPAGDLNPQLSTFVRVAFDVPKRSDYWVSFQHGLWVWSEPVGLTTASVHPSLVPPPAEDPQRAPNRLAPDDPRVIEAWRDAHPDLRLLEIDGELYPRPPRPAAAGDAAASGGPEPSKGPNR